MRTWDRLAHCESGGRWHVATGNGYFGGLQFSGSTWRAFGGKRYAMLPHHATRTQQVRVAERVRHAQGWGAWPSCSRRVGLR
ncbi:MAG: transglycosylase family protein [Nocardioidaceae bacterium]